MTELERPDNIPSRHATVIRIVAAILVVAAAAKGHALVLGHALQMSTLATAAQVGGELLLAVWLLSGVYAPLAWLAALCTFTVFSVVAAAELWRGQNSCGCFGMVTVPPEITLSLDVAAAAVLLFMGPALRAMTRPQTRGVRAASIGLIAIL